MKRKKKICSFLLAAVLLISFTAFAGAAFLPGDVSGDGEVTAEDARLCLRKAVGLETYETGSDEYNACDVTGDNEVTAEDARLILRAAVGLETLGLPEKPEDPAPQPDYTGNNEYDIYRSGGFYLTGSMNDGSGVHPMEAAKSDDLFYMCSDMEGQQVAIQVIGNDVYMIHSGKNAYYKMDKATMSILGLDLDDLKNEVNMGAMPALSEADTVTDGLLDALEPCRIYTFRTSDGGCTQIYMNGDRFLGMDSFTSNWVRTESLRITSITKDLPAKVTTPGGGGKRTLLLTTFMGYFM